MCQCKTRALRSMTTKLSLLLLAIVVVYLGTETFDYLNSNIDTSTPSPSDPSVRLLEPFGERLSDKHENGYAFDQAFLDIKQGVKIIVPHDAVVVTKQELRYPHISMMKVLQFVGPPGMTIYEARKQMGCAMKREDETVQIATFGEWNSHIEGGAHLNLVIAVPDGMVVEKRKGLSGEKSECLNKEILGNGIFPRALAEGWGAITSTPDPEHSAFPVRSYWSRVAGPMPMLFCAFILSGIFIVVLWRSMHTAR